MKYPLKYSIILRLCCWWRIHFLQHMQTDHVRACAFSEFPANSFSLSSAAIGLALGLGQSMAR